MQLAKQILHRSGLADIQKESSRMAGILYGEAQSEKFWELERRIREDKRKAGVCLGLKRSAMIDNIIQLVHEGAIDMADLDDFSDTLKDAVRFVCERIGK